MSEPLTCQKAARELRTSLSWDPALRCGRKLNPGTPVPLRQIWDPNPNRYIVTFPLFSLSGFLWNCQRTERGLHTPLGVDKVFTYILTGSSLSNASGSQLTKGLNRRRQCHGQDPGPRTEQNIAFAQGVLAIRRLDGIVLSSSTCNLPSNWKVPTPLRSVQPRRLSESGSMLSGRRSAGEWLGIGAIQGLAIVGV